MVARIALTVALGLLLLPRGIAAQSRIAVLRKHLDVK